MSNLKQKLDALLRPNPHEHERHLACCTLLVKSDTSVVHNVLEQHPILLEFIFQIINLDSVGTIEMKRIGLRVLYLYLSCVECDATRIRSRDWCSLVNLLAQRCQQGKGNIQMIDVELLQVLMLGIEKAGKSNNSSSTIGLNLNDLCMLPDLIMKRFCSRTDASPLDAKTVKVNEVQDDREMMEFLQKILDSENESCSSPCVTPRQLFSESMILFMVSYANKFQSFHHDKGVKIKSPLTIDLIENIVDVLFGRKRELLVSTKESQDLSSLLHYALLVFLSNDLSSSRDQSIILQERIKTKKGNNLDNWLQRIILSGITSQLDSTWVSVPHKETALEIQPMSRAIRPISIHIFATLLEHHGIEWTFSFDNVHQGSLGCTTNYCTMVRLVAGELRIVLGRLVDQAMIMKDPEPSSHTIKPKDFVVASEDLQMCQDAIRIGLIALKHVLDLASNSAEEDGERSGTYDFNADSILHLRHTMEDFLNSCIQFILEDVNHGSFIGWDDCAYECCRFMGAYLSQVNIFDYDLADNDVAPEENHHMYDSYSTKVDTVTILRAMKQAMNICFAWNDNNVELSCMKATTLFPSLLSILTCCENSKEASIVARHLFSNTIMSCTIEKILSSIEITNGVSSSSMYANLDVISWCCLLIVAITELQSMIPKQSTKMIQRQSIASTLSSLSVQYLERMQEEGIIGNDVVNILHQLFDAWNAIKSDDGIESALSNDSQMTRVFSVLSSKDVVLRK